MDMEIFFPGNKRVHARYGDFVIETDQPVRAGGDESAPTPFDMFVSTLGTCAGIFVLGFMQQRGIPYEGTRLLLSTSRNQETKMVDKISLQIMLPQGFPEKYRDAVIRAADQCTVKRHLENPPEIEVTATQG
jgi:putative redox protein